MISKQNLWFLTLFSLIFVLSIYYITMPNDLLKNKTVDDTQTESAKVDVEEVSSLLAMRVSLEEERQSSIDQLQEQLISDVLGSEEKNNVYEQLKYLNEIQSKEEDIEKKIKKQCNINCFVKIDNSNAEVVCIAKQHNNKLANDVMRIIQGEYKNKMFITVKFQKS